VGTDPGRGADTGRGAGPRELADLPYAAVLQPNTSGLRPHGEYDCEHFDKLSLEDPAAASARFLECAFTGVTMRGGQFRRARFIDAWLQDMQLVTTGLAETSWQDVTITGAVLAGTEAYGAQLSRVTLRGCKLDSVNFRDASLTDVTLDGCLLRDVDFGGASLTRTVFTDCRLEKTDLSRVTLDQVDLRGAELGIIIGPDSLRGAIVTTGQLVMLAPLLADSLGITISDG
jgi:uncharacterized protein YjbI with pentapeptide repeats